MATIEVISDEAVYFVDRQTGNVLDAIPFELSNTTYQEVTHFNPLHPALLMAEEWDEVPVHKFRK